jgi:hypothetical protein
MPLHRVANTRFANGIVGKETAVGQIMAYHIPEAIIHVSLVLS